MVCPSLEPCKAEVGEIMVTTNREKTVNCRSVGVNSSARPSTNPNSTAFPFCSPSTESSPLLGLSLKVGFGCELTADWSLRSEILFCIESDFQSELQLLT